MGHSARLAGRVSLHALRCQAQQGDPPASTQLLVDVTIRLDLKAVAQSDAYQDVVDLAALAACVRESLAAQPKRLLESLAIAAAGSILQRFPTVGAVRLRVTKPEPEGLDASAESAEVRLKP